MHELVKIAKGMIDAGDLNPGGQLRPQAAERLISLVTSNGFLSQVTTHRMRRLTADVQVVDIPARSLVRVPEGQTPTDAQRIGASEHGTTLHALPVQLFPQISLSFLRDNADNPGLVSQLEQQFATRMEAELEDLAFNGVADDNSAGFTTLNKGWLQVARESTAVQKVAISGTSPVVDPATDGWRATLKAIYERLPEVYRPQAAFVMNSADADEYAFEVAGHVTGSALVADSPLRRFLGRPIVTSPYMPQSKVLLTPLKNLIFGISTDIRRTRRFDPDARALRYVFDLAVDYEIAIKQAVVLAE